MREIENKKVVIFDLDDTLIPNVKYYNLAKQHLVKVLQEIFKVNFNSEEFLKKYAEFDYIKAHRIGLDRARFPMSAVQTYIHYCKELGKEIVAEEMDDVFMAANTVFEYVDKIPEVAVNMFNELKQKGYEVFLLTSGDDLIQTYKIYKSDILKVLPEEKIIIVPMKTDDTYYDYFGKYGLENCVMVGNSKNSDINPAINVGMYAIYIPQDTWKFEEATLKESDKLYTTSSLDKVCSIVEEIFAEKEELAS